MTGPGTRPTVERMRDEGFWNPLWDDLDRMDPAWTEQYMAAAMQPLQSGSLTPREIQLLCIAVDASCLHMYAPGVRRHIRAALELGVEPEAILDVLKFATTVGIHSCNIGVPILVEEMERRAASGPVSPPEGFLPRDGAADPQDRTLVDLRRHDSEERGDHDHEHDRADDLER